MHPRFTMANLLAVLAALSIILAVLAVVVNQFILAGVCLLLTSFSIYLRETRT